MHPSRAPAAATELKEMEKAGQMEIERVEGDVEVSETEDFDEL